MSTKGQMGQDPRVVTTYERLHRFYSAWAASLIDSVKED